MTWPLPVPVCLTLPPLLTLCSSREELRAALLALPATCPGPSAVPQPLRSSSFCLECPSPTSRALSSSGPQFLSRLLWDAVFKAAHWPSGPLHSVLA